MDDSGLMFESDHDADIDEFSPGDDRRLEVQKVVQGKNIWTRIGQAQISD